VKFTNSPKKIALVGYSFGCGGGDKAMANFSVLLAEKGHDVHNIIIHDAVDYEFKGKLHNLGLVTNPIKFVHHLKRFAAFFAIFRKEHFDIIIDFRFRLHVLNEILIYFLVYNSRVIYTVHSFLTHVYVIPNRFLIKYLYRNLAALITVSKKIEDKLITDFQFKNTETIYNVLKSKSIIENANESIQIEGKFIVAVGRMQDNVKQFDVLIKAYAQSVLPKNKIKLVIVGWGDLLVSHQALAQELQLEDLVVFVGKVKNPFPYYKNALYTVLTSKNEGFPTVLLESLVCKTPVIAFDCLSGPNEIITNKKNGLLIENQDFEALKNGLNLLYEDKVLYQFCKSNTNLGLEKFEGEVIYNQWEKHIETA
jgi:N-acetylgalactosamine-N,N'-diacetylbacillosaminyl-diphospho-undecaprenol 4-alpha-N-acetylgalactosaminyltransferase